MTHVLKADFSKEPQLSQPRQVAVPPFDHADNLPSILTWNVPAEHNWLGLRPGLVQIQDDGGLAWIVGRQIVNANRANHRYRRIRMIFSLKTEKIQVVIAHFIEN